MPILAGWLRSPAPPRPGLDARGKNGGRRHKVAAPPAGGGDGGGASEAGAEQPPIGDDCGPGSGSAKGHAHAGDLAAGPVPGALGVAAILSSARHWGFLWKALALHSANLAATLAARPLQPLHDRLQRQLAATVAVKEACRQLGVEGLQELQDLLNCIILSEHVYKIVDHDTDTSVSFINSVKALFPPQLVTLRGVQWAQPHVRHRFLLGESHDALYVSFMGTKLPRDMATNANLFQEEVVLDAAMLSSGAAPAADDEDGGGVNGGGAAGGGGRALAAHRGFLARARSVPIHSLYREARARGKRLVLCGHSLGGAVASLCAIQLLQHLPPNLHHTVSCFGFATPALGNDALAATVAECGWDARIRNYLSPDDPIPKLLSFRRPPGVAAAEKAAAAEAAAPPSAAAHEAPAPPAAPQGAASEAAGAAGNVVPAPRLAAGAQQRLRRVASHVTAGGGGGSSGGIEAEQQKQQREQEQCVTAAVAARGSGLPRSGSAPALLARTGAAAASADSAPKAGAASRQHGGGRLARVGVAAATGAAVAAAMLGQDVDVAAATSAAVAAAMMRQEGTPAQVQGSGGRGPAGVEGQAADGSSRPRGRQHWLGQRLAAAAAPPLRAAAHRASSAALAAAAPPVRAVVERAGSAARLVALPLSAAASVPMRAAPQYVPLGQQLYITPAAVTAARPLGDTWDAPLPPATSLPPPRRAWTFWGAAPAAAAAAESAARPAAAPASGSLGGSLDDEDNVDVAVAAALGDPAAMAAAAAAGAAGEGEEGGGRRRRRGVFEAHRMATYRTRLLAICQGSLEGRLLLRSLPSLPSLPRPGDVAATELLAPSMFPLKAVATVAQAAAAPAAAAAAQPGAGAGTGAQPGAGRQAQFGEQAPMQRRGFWGRLLARAARQQRQEPPVELLIRVEGRGLSNVTKAWIEGVPLALPPAPMPADGSGAEHSGGGGDKAAAAAGKPAATVAEVTIVQQPAAPLLPPPRERPLLPVFSQLSAVASWLAVTLGWVALLRQLQPAGNADFLLARVRLPAAAVRDAQKAAQNSLLTSVTDGPLLHGLHAGPRLSLRLQSDFAVHSLPLDIRVATSMPPMGQRWAWPWAHRTRRPRAAKQQAHAQQQQQRGSRWWEWPGSSAAAGH